MTSYGWPTEGASSSSVVSSLNGLKGAITLAAGSNVTITPSGNVLTIAATGGGGSGVDTIGTIDSQPASADGAVITGTDLIMQSASATVPGLVNLTTQTFAGVKTFANIIDSGLTASTALIANGSKQLASSATTSTELGFVSGVTSAIQAQIDSKQATLTIGNLTAAGADGIAVTSGTGAVIGSGTSIAQHVADTTHSGYLSSTDWNTFNGKQAAGTYVTAVSVASANGFAGSSSGGATPALTLSTSITGLLKGNGTALSAATSGTDYSAGTSALSTGILKSTTTTGALTIAVAGDFPTLNQNTTGTAANITASSNSTITTLSSLSLPATQLTGTIAAARMPALTGDVTTSAGAVATTLATVNSNVGSFTAANITVNAKGLITAAANGTASVTAVAFTATSSTSSVSNGSQTTLVNPTVDLDTNSAYNNSTGVFTAPSSGVYIFQGSFTSNAAITTVVNDAALLVFSKNGGAAAYSVRSVQQAVGTSRIALNASSPPISLAINDTVVLQLNNATGSTLTGNGNAECFFSGFKVGN